MFAVQDLHASTVHVLADTIHNEDDNARKEVSIVYTISQDRRVSFHEAQTGAWTATVVDEWQRVQELPVACAPNQTPRQALEILSQQAPEQHPYRIHIIDEDQSLGTTRAVYVGALGLRGGGNGSSSTNPPVRRHVHRTDADTIQNTNEATLGGKASVMERKDDFENTSDDEHKKYDATSPSSSGDNPADTRDLSGNNARNNTSSIVVETVFDSSSDDSHATSTENSLSKSGSDILGSILPNEDGYSLSSSSLKFTYHRNPPGRRISDHDSVLLNLNLPSVGGSTSMSVTGR